MVGARTMERARQLLTGKCKGFGAMIGARTSSMVERVVNFGARTPSMMGRQLDGVPRARKRRRRLSSSSF